MKYNYKKYLFIVFSFTLYFILRFKVSYYITSSIHQENFTHIPYFPWSYYLYHIIFNASFGMLIGLEDILNERKKRGKWMLDLGRIGFLTLPIFLLSLGEFIYFKYTNIYLIKTIIEYFNISITLLQILFGFTLIKSFYKKVC